MNLYLKQLLQNGIKKPGDAVRVDELLLKLKTEKVTLEVNDTAKGVSESIDVEKDTTGKVGQVVGKIKEGSVPAAPTPAASITGKTVDPTTTIHTTICTKNGCGKQIKSSEYP